MSRLSTPINDPRYDPRWKMPGYTGHVNGLCETLGSTPVTAQRKAFFRNGWEMDPTGEAWVPAPGKDPLNKDGGMKKRCVPDLLWSNLTDRPMAARKGENGSSLRLGDPRFMMKVTHYNDTHQTPELGCSIWKPAVNIKDHKYDLVAMDPAERIALYERMFDKVGEVALQHIEDNLRLRFASKLNTASNTNGFKLLKLFQNFDKKCTGTIEIHDFRKAMGSYGIQLQDAVEICLYAKFDTDGNGTLDYKEFVSHFVEGEYLHLGFSSLPDAEVRQLQQANAPEDDALMKMKVKLSDRFRQLTGIDAGERLKDAFAAVDPSRTGAVSKAYFTIIMDQMNLKFSDMEMECIENVFKTESGDISYVEFANQLCVKREETVMGRTSYKRSMNRYFQERC